MYLVVFRNRKRDDLDVAAYDVEAARMEELAREQPGYRAFKSYVAADGEAIALSEWDDEASARAWGREAEHALARANGRAHYYQDYTLFGCPDPRIHAFSRAGRGGPQQ